MRVIQTRQEITLETLKRWISDNGGAWIPCMDYSGNSAKDEGGIIERNKNRITVVFLSKVDLTTGRYDLFSPNPNYKSAAPAGFSYLGLFSSQPYQRSQALLEEVTGLACQSWGGEVYDISPSLNTGYCRGCGFELEGPLLDSGDNEYLRLIRCPCCGHGRKDSEKIVPTVSGIRGERGSWIHNGASWFEPSCRPSGWSLDDQLAHAVSKQEGPNWIGRSFLPPEANYKAEYYDDGQLKSFEGPGGKLGLAKGIQRGNFHDYHVKVYLVYDNGLESFFGPHGWYECNWQVWRDWVIKLIQRSAEREDERKHRYPDRAWSVSASRRDSGDTRKKEK